MRIEAQRQRQAPARRAAPRWVWVGLLPVAAACARPAPETMAWSYGERLQGAQNRAPKARHQAQDKPRADAPQTAGPTVGHVAIQTASAAPPAPRGARRQADRAVGPERPATARARDAAATASARDAAATARARDAAAAARARHPAATARARDAAAGAKTRARSEAGGGTHAQQGGAGTAAANVPRHLPKIRLQPTVRVVEHDLRSSRRLPATLEFRWPLPVGGINSFYGKRHDPLDGDTRFHYGVDMDANYGDVVKAAAPGWVVHAGWNGGHGRQVVVQHRGGYRSSYSHLARILVFKGASIAAGQAIGQVGNSGRSTGPHLHFELRRGGHHLDPMRLLGRKVVLE